MRDLRLVGYEDGTVIFESLEGEKYRVLADDALRQATRQAALARPSELSITPREIQDRIRSGETVAQLAAVTGAAEEFIEKFAQPVLDELEHIVQSALAIRITIAGDRFNDDVQEEFGNLISNRLRASGASDLRWSSKRADGGTWQVTATYKIGEHSGLAVWTFEPRKFHLSPENESAVALSNHSSTMDGAISKLRTVADLTATAGSIAAEPISISTQRSLDKNGVSAPAAFRKSEPEAPTELSGDSEPTASTTDLLEELRRRRESVEPQEIDEATVTDFDDDFEDEVFEPLTGPLQVVPEFIDETPEVEGIDEITEEPGEEFDEPTNDLTDTEPEELAEPKVPDANDLPGQDEAQEQQTDAGLNTQPAPAPSSKKGRAAMPSWDEIVFGTKTDDEL